MSTIKNLFLFIAALLLNGCAKNMQIDNSLLEGDVAKLTISAPELDGYISIPLVNSKFVGVKLFNQQDACKNLNYASWGGFGKARLTPSAHTQTFDIPASEKLYITTIVEEAIGGTITKCSSALAFVPKNQSSYKLEVIPQKVFNSNNCMIKVLKLSPDESEYSMPEGLRWFRVDWTGEAKDESGCNDLAETKKLSNTDVESPDS